MRIRGQCEVFIALAVDRRVPARAAARARPPASAAACRRGSPLVAGALFGVAFVYKYNAGTYLIVGLLAAIVCGVMTIRPDPLVTRAREAAGRAFALIAGFALIVAAPPRPFHLAGALDDLYGATIAYNMFYSGETYSSPLHMIGYLLTFPILHARLDALWFLGGLAAPCCCSRALRAPARWVAPLWVAAACLSIAVNGSRGLPQYFLQAGPPMALAAGWGAVLVWHRTTPIARIVLTLLLAIGAARVTSFDKAIDYTAYDLRAWTGALTREAVPVAVRRARLGRQISALAIHELARHLRRTCPRIDASCSSAFRPARSSSRSAPARRASSGAAADRRLQRRQPGYGVSGPARRAAAAPAGRGGAAAARLGSRHHRLGHVLPRQPPLVAWLEAGYEPSGELGNFLLYTRRK